MIQYDNSIDPVPAFCDVRPVRLLMGLRFEILPVNPELRQIACFRAIQVGWQGLKIKTFNNSSARRRRLVG